MNQQTVLSGACLLFLAGCCGKSEDTCSYAQSHADKLRRHFQGERVDDVATLIRETMAVSARLKADGLTKQANEFDSYVDVLMYGNRTIDESLDDTMALVKHKKQVCTSFQKVKTRVCGMFR